MEAASYQRGGESAVCLHALSYLAVLLFYASMHILTKLVQQHEYSGRQPHPCTKEMDSLSTRKCIASGKIHSLHKGAS